MPPGKLACRRLALLLPLAGLAAGCARGPSNLLANPGFEQGREGWSWRESSPHWRDFAIADEPVHGGAAAAHLPLRQPAGAEPRSVVVHGVVQELRPERFPETISGWYRVERWDKSAPETDLYLQLVVIVWGDPRTPEIVSPRRPIRRLRNYQLRYYLAGLEEPAFSIRNARLLFVSRGPPPRGEWRRFEVPLRRDFEEQWGVVPEGFESLRVLFEARWDNMPPGSSVHADVYFDDLYVGP